jgi:hypothetical protein
MQSSIPDRHTTPDNHTVIDNPEMLSPGAFFASLPPALRMVMLIVLLFSMARFFVDGMGLQLMGRSLSQGGDFMPYYVSGAMLRDGLNIYDTELSASLTLQYTGREPVTQGAVGYLYPPLIALLMMPITLLPVEIAYRLWVVIQAASLFVSIYFLARNLPMLGKWAWPLLLILALNMYPVYLAIDIGQVNMLVLLSLALTIHFARRGQLLWAGVWIGVGAMIKVVPLVLIGFFFLQKRWMVLIGALISVVALFGVAMLVAGPNTVMSFFSSTLSSTIPSQVAIPANASIHGLIYRLTTTLGVPEIGTAVRWVLVLLCLGTVSLFSLKTYELPSAPFLVAMSLWITAIFIISPTTWEHNLPWMIPVFGAVAAGIASVERVPTLIHLGFGGLYTLLAFENLPLNRSGQWNFGTGFWIFKGEYLQQTFFADVRFFAFTAFLILSIITLGYIYPRSMSIFDNLKTWFITLIKFRPAGDLPVQAEKAG